MSSHRLGTTGVHRIDLNILRETQHPLQGGVIARAGLDQALGTTLSPVRALSCAGASHRHRDGTEPKIIGLGRPEPGPAHASRTFD
jgi:hypothetical protein